MPGPSFKEIARLCEISENTLFRWRREEGVDIGNPREIWKRMQMIPDRHYDEPPTGLQLLLSLNVRWEK
jgi:transposase-like protein